ncbi:restriction endonuclease [Streptomyces sp. SA15]|uniref:Uma2 family endonuclease n=1 Tax=Streptomyces sp. SA15 TaxID=934019 RepID=UPI000BAEA956|nr:Uma2 family endonuclease [Streptomyces sp. SA15]PAZ11445.1 restriction endonuclease [Streptomyces sp. SA15]
MGVPDGDYIMADNEWDELVWIWEQTDAPKGCKVEIIEGLVTVTPLSAGAHHAIAERVQRPLYEVIPEEWDVYQRLGMAVPSRLGLYVPDLAVMPMQTLRAGNGNFVPAGDAELVVEVTSRATARNDRIHKSAGYAEAGISLYLLIDSLAPGGPTITLYGEPKGDVYRLLHACKFGDQITLPLPFDLALDTGEFLMG